MNRPSLALSALIAGFAITDTALAAPLSAPADHPKTYLASITIPLKKGEAVAGFSIATWGVRINAVCHLPSGWTIKAGANATPQGVIEGRGSLGATWIRRSNSKELQNLMLVTLYGPVQRRDVGRDGGPIHIPATFKGSARIEDDEEHMAPLNHLNVLLTPATRCPVAQR